MRINIISIRKTIMNIPTIDVETYRGIFDHHPSLKPTNPFSESLAEN